MQSHAFPSPDPPAQPAEVFSQLLDQAWTEAHPVLQTVGGEAEACGPDGCAI